MAQSPRAREVLRSIGARIRAARTRAGLTQEQAAAACGIDYKRWQRLEAGGVNATVATLVRVSEAVESPFWDLFSPMDSQVHPVARARR